MKGKKPVCKEEQEQRSYLYKIYIITSSVGLEVVFSVALGIFAGLWIDKRYQSSPWGLLGGALVGALSAAKRLIAFTQSYLR